MPDRSSRSRPGIPRAIALSLLALAAWTAHAVAAPRTSPGSPARVAKPYRTRAFDIERRLDVGRINLFTSNAGSFAWDLLFGASGLEWPRGSGQTAVFASGLWLGGLVGGTPRVTVAEYSQEYLPGSMNGPFPDPPFGPDHRVYKLVRWTGNPADSEHVERSPAEQAADPLLDPLYHHGWAEYRAGAASHGAPMRVYRLPVTATPDPTDSVDVPGPDVSGDMMLWCVYNDADPSAHTDGAGGTPPLGLEVQQTLFAFGGPGDLRDVVYLRFRIENKGGNTIDDFHASLWCDADLGTFSDDLVGCDVGRGLGFAYNANEVDGVYGTPPPAVGYSLLRAAGAPSGMSAFTRYTNGGDPLGAGQSFNLMKGLHADGSQQLSPVTGLPTPFALSGDPLSGAGWVDTSPSDQRFLLSSAPGTLIPGAVRELSGAISMGRGGDRLASVGVTRCVSDLAQNMFEVGFTRPLPVQDAPCSTAVSSSLVNCPRPAFYWQAQCEAGGAAELGAAKLAAVASLIDQRSTLFDWSAGALGSFCATVAPLPGADARQRARREYATFMANVAGMSIPLPVAGGQRILLYPPTPVSCPPLTATNVSDLAAKADLSPTLTDAHYLDLNGNGQSLEGFDAGLQYFGRGAGYASLFLGSSIIPNIDPDSFATVEVRFSTTARQKAHRLLRLEKFDGSPPANVGRGYEYAGFLDCDFQVWDVTHGVQLDAVFVERMLVSDDDGTLSPDSSLIASLDRTWAPTDVLNGGREYLMILNRPYDGTPKDVVRVAGGLLNGQIPLLYALSSHRAAGFAGVDSGDAFRFEWALPPSTGADLRLIELEGQSLADPAVQQAYSDLIDCLSAINSGLGIGETCNSIPTPTLVSLVDALAAPDRVVLRWHADADLSATVERRAPGGTWRALGQVAPDGSHEILFEDRDVLPGRSYEYRLAVQGSGGLRYFGQARVDVPASARLALLGLRIEAGSSRLVVNLSLASREAARLDVLDVAGRRIAGRDLLGLEPGVHQLAIGDGSRLPAGIYLLRLQQGGQQVSGKTAFVR